MARLKCIGCNQLRREKRPLWGSNEVNIVYTCPLFPYVPSISGLIRPASGITRAAEKCPEDPTKSCIICGTGKHLTTYGIDVLRTCVTHYKAWSKWLDERPEKREVMRPLGRVRDAGWIDVFREFVEESRQPA
jgi:hypothetical protein